MLTELFNFELLIDRDHIYEDDKAPYQDRWWKQLRIAENNCTAKSLVENLTKER